MSKWPIIACVKLKQSNLVLTKVLLAKRSFIAIKKLDCSRRVVILLGNDDIEKKENLYVFDDNHHVLTTCSYILNFLFANTSSISFSLCF